MSISIEEVDRIAKLARLTFSPEEKQKLQTEMSAILDYVDQLKKVEGMAASPADSEGLNLMRDDVAEMPIEPEEFLNQAPAREGRYLKVKSILE